MTVKRILYLAVAGLMVVSLSACGGNHLDGNYSGPFSVDDCAQLMVNTGFPDNASLRIVCAQQLGTLGQAAFDAQMVDSIRGIGEFNDLINDLQDPNYYTP
jgi:hypothetical protein